MNRRNSLASKPLGQRPRWLLWLMTAWFVLGLAACSSPGVRPWQRDLLSKPEMQFGGDEVGALFNQHFYFSKEGSSGGQGFAGGGCGCN
jgi:hypothetical protein